MEAAEPGIETLCAAYPRGHARYVSITYDVGEVQVHVAVPPQPSGLVGHVDLDSRYPLGLWNDADQILFQYQFLRSAVDSLDLSRRPRCEPSRGKRETAALNCSINPSPPGRQLRAWLADLDGWTLPRYSYWYQEPVRDRP